MSDDRKRLQARAQRVTINREFGSIEELVREYVSNISSSGAFIRSEEPLPIGTKVNLRFTVIVDDLETIEGVGEVVRSSDDPPGMGVVFTKLGSMSRVLIERLIVQERRRK
ncbi:MAG: PilZ domain-containing protein [Deltaproteobacteria bacterium]|jgi:hypothetical protein|nr:PilZ domain-containing protein [Deltaproteobacteria bacterium]